MQVGRGTNRKEFLKERETATKISQHGFAPLYPGDIITN